MREGVKFIAGVLWTAGYTAAVVALAPFMGYWLVIFAPLALFTIGALAAIIQKD